MSGGEDGALSRRALLTAVAGAAGGAAVAAAARPASAAAQAGGDATILSQALTLEQVTIASYAAALRDGPQEPSLTRLLRRFQHQEREHAEILASALDTLGSRPPQPPRDAGELTRAREQLGLTHPLGQLTTTADVARFAIELENAQMTLYLGAVRELGDNRLLAVATQIMAAEGQHATVLRGLLADDPAEVVPSAFETGDATIP